VGVIHLATASSPLFNRALFADRNYVVALLFMLVVGVVMFATMALLPPMLQRLFGYGVIDTGMALMPRGVGTLIAMQFAGLLVRRGVDARIMVGIGFTIAGLSLWEMSRWSLDVDNWNIVLSGFVQGMGMGLVFIPLNATAFATLSPELRTEGSSLLNLSRSIGSSVGISVVTSMLARNIQTSHSDLTAHLTASATNLIDFSALDRYQELGDRALSMVDAMVNREAAMIAYVNDFTMMMWMSFAALPLVLLMRRSTGSFQRDQQAIAD
jgi:DHA2 family multidrug resistance protein